MKSLSNRDGLLKEIFDLTLSFQLKYPEIYENLLETPLFLTYKNKDISKKEFLNYREFLKAQFEILEATKANTRLIVL
ncbi:hypothetical protein NE848_10785 [Gramella jeungdoensis]|uniref:Uncharacterized protein n=1 Tax=Gramella jeungdoensis TaxID=708091 RepID=A0ABT0Z2B3_9FLAO|nr:hypothetical protein [Gramella jeungdoensis]MCM8569867.1 hypothetical protein [Gramella jeungdoensis]